jgi:hypothetical protein
LGTRDKILLKYKIPPRIRSESFTAFRMTEKRSG